jgi:5-methylcytosine-specific restriction endonuclease McrA
MIQRDDVIAIANDYEAMQFFKKKAKGYKGIEFADLVQIYLEQEKECALCGDRLELDTRKTHLDHIVPKAKGGEDWAGNLELVCAACNYAKRDTSLKDFVLLCLKVENKYHNTEILPKDIIQQIVERRWRKEQLKQKVKLNG